MSELHNIHRRERSDGLLTTGDMARLTGNTLRTVRFYEEAGILRPDHRSAGGHRLFSHRELQRLQFITDMRTAGSSLDEIRELLDLKHKAETGGQAANEAILSLHEQIDTIEAKIEVFSRLAADLQQTRDALQGCTTCTDRQYFPDRCGQCEVMCSNTKLPASMRVLWSLDS